MEYWIVWKFNNGIREYISGTDEYGYPEHTKNIEEAYCFKDFNVVISYINLGYCVCKEYK